jgi:hypothetical protein
MRETRWRECEIFSLRWIIGGRNLKKKWMKFRSGGTYPHSTAPPPKKTLIDLHCLPCRRSPATPPRRFGVARLGHSSRPLLWLLFPAPFYCQLVQVCEWNPTVPYALLRSGTNESKYVHASIWRRFTYIFYIFITIFGDILELFNRSRYINWKICFQNVKDSKDLY